MHMNQTSQDVLQFVAENDVKFIRLAFCDLSGFQKNIAIQSSELQRAFEEGISFDASAAGGFAGVEDSDLFLVPDPATLSVLPWRPAQGRVARMFCGIVRPDGAPYDADARALLKQAARRAAEMGYSVQVGAECEFYLFETDEYDRPTMIPHDRGGYCDIAPLDRGENIRREICLTLESLGMRPESSHHEQGPGQNEVDFRYTGALTAADHLLGFKAAVKSIAAQSGLYASFLPKPFLEYSGSGLHINLSLFQDGKNLVAHGAPVLELRRIRSAQICYLVARQPFAAYSHTGGARRIQPYRAAFARPCLQSISGPGTDHSCRAGWNRRCAAADAACGHQPVRCRAIKCLPASAARPGRSCGMCRRLGL